MRTIIIFFLLLFTALTALSQAYWYKPGTDTSHTLGLQIAPQLRVVYSYYYNTEIDTLYFQTGREEKERFMKIPVNAGFKTFLFEEMISRIDKIKIDPKHQTDEQRFSVIYHVESNYSYREVATLDKYYLSQLLPMFIKFNSFLPPQARIDCNFDYKSIKRFDTTYVNLTLDRCGGCDHPKDKLLKADLKHERPFDLTYYDETEKSNKWQAIRFDQLTRNTLKLKLLNYVNSFSIKSKRVIKTTDLTETFSVVYAVRGISLTTKFLSIEKAFRDKKSIDLLNYLNSKLDKKYKFD